MFQSYSPIFLLCDTSGVGRRRQDDYFYFQSFIFGSSFIKGQQRCETIPSAVFFFFFLSFFVSSPLIHCLMVEVYFPSFFSRLPEKDASCQGFMSYSSPILRRALSDRSTNLVTQLLLLFLWYPAWREGGRRSLTPRGLMSLRHFFFFLLR